MNLRSPADPESSLAVGYDAIFSIAMPINTDALHKKLEEKFGARSGSGYLWSRYPDGRVVCRFPYALDGTRPVQALALDDKAMIRARVNITKKNQNGKRRSWPLHDKKPRREWLERRGLEHGFSVGPMAIIVEKDDINHKGKQFWIDATEFTGWLTVTDAEKFNRVLATGLSARRAWGFGLIEVLERQSPPQATQSR